MAGGTGDEARINLFPTEGRENSPRPTTIIENTLAMLSRQLAASCQQHNYGCNSTGHGDWMCTSYDVITSTSYDDVIMMSLLRICSHFVCVAKNSTR